MSTISELALEVEALLSQIWFLAPEPKPIYSDWFYGKGGPKNKMDEWIRELEKTK